MGNGNIFVPLDRVEELENRIQDVPLALLNGSWVREEDENGNLLYYRQDVEVKGLSADSTPMILPKWAGEEPVEEELNAYDCLIGEPIITEGNIRFMANPMPQWSFTMVAKGAMAAEGQDIDAVAGLVAKMNELETEVDVLNRNKQGVLDWDNQIDISSIIQNSNGDNTYTVPSDGVLYVRISSGDNTVADHRIWDKSWDEKKLGFDYIVTDLITPNHYGMANQMVEVRKDMQLYRYRSANCASVRVVFVPYK